MTPNYAKLEKNLIDMVLEQQAKLGYMSETVRLYYPLDSLNRMLGISASPDEMLELLAEFGERTRERLGGVKASRQGERFCLLLPPDMSDYVHGLYAHGSAAGKSEEESGGMQSAGTKPVPEDYRFILDFVQTISAHGCTIETLRALFSGYSEKVHFEKMDNGEFDYLLYFTDGKPDDYRYCVTDEGIHLTYHRYTPEDYEAFDF